MPEAVEIERLKAHAAALQGELARVEAEIRRLRCEATGIKIGDIVMRKGKRYRVAAIDPKWAGTTWLAGNPERADGTFGTAVRNLYSDWERIP